MDPVSLLLAFLIVNTVFNGWAGSVAAGMVGGAVGAARSAVTGGGSRGGSTRHGGPARSGGSRGSTAVQTCPVVEPSTGGHIRQGAADGFHRAWTASTVRRRTRRERLRGWWRARQEKRRPAVEAVDPDPVADPVKPAESPQPTAVVPAPRDESTDDTQTPPAGPVSGESPKEGTRMADVSATQSVTFWEDIADQVSRQVEAEQSAELAVNGAADVKDKCRGHAQQVADEFSGLIEAAKGTDHEYAGAYRS